jgi:hypothetical protein
MNVKTLLVIGGSTSEGGGGGGVIRHGRVRADDRHLADDDGPLLARICSLFWAPWGERDDVPRLERNFGSLQAGAFHGYRALSGLAGPSWEDRRIDVGDVETVAEMIDRGYDQFGLRVWLVPFADGHEGSGSEADILRITDDYCRVLKGREHKIILIEAVNEISDGIKIPFELAREVTRRFRDKLGVIACPSAPGTIEHAEELYGGLNCPGANVHIDRDTGGDGGRFEPVWKMFECREWIPQVRQHWSGEPIGPGASVNQEYDPLRLVMTYANTFITGGALYCLHPYAGIRGGGKWDQSDISGQPRSGPVHLDETPEWNAITAGMKAVEATLPGDLSGWERHNGHWGSNPLDFVLGQPHNGPFEDGRLHRCCAMVRGDKFYESVLRLKGTIEVGARSRMRVEVLDGLTMAELSTHDLEGGQSFSLTSRQPSGWNWDGDGLILRGVFT